MSASFLRRLGAAAWLGWQVESNWADPFVFAVYSLIRPLATALLLVAMYVVVAGSATGDPRFAWIYVGNAFQEPVYLTSGMYFPLSALGPWAVVGLAVAPLTLGLDALRQLLLGPAARGLLPVGLETALLALCVVLFLAVAAVSWRRLEERAKREGRITLRWQ